MGGRYNDEWHRVHLINPRELVPESNMPGYPWLAKAPLDGAQVQVRMKALGSIGVPYSAQEIDEAPAAVKGKTEMDALIAYLQGLGTALR